MVGPIGLLLCLLFAPVAAASGKELNGVIATQPVTPGNYMNPAFTGTVDVNVHYPTQMNAQTGLLVVLHGLGGHYHSYDLECNVWRDQYNVVTVQVNYRGTGRPPPPWDFGKYQAIDVLRVVDYMLTTHTLNRQRVFLWGASAGGFVALHTAKMAPRTFAFVAALAPITRPTNQQDRQQRGYENDPAPGGWEGFMLGQGKTYTVPEWDIRDLQYLAAELKGIPVYLFHGDKDTIVDWQHSRDLATALAAAGGKVTFVTIKGGDHNFQGAAPTENSRFKVTQKYLAQAFVTLTAPGPSELTLQAKRVFSTRQGVAYPVKFDIQGRATLDAIPRPGAVVYLTPGAAQVPRNGPLPFTLALENWQGQSLSLTLLAGFVDLTTGNVLPLVGPAPVTLAAGGLSASLSLPLPGLAAGDHLFVVVLMGTSPAPFVELDYFQFRVTP